MYLDLARCPFCAGSKITVQCTEDNGFYWVRCSKCKISGPVVSEIIRYNQNHKQWRENAIRRAVQKWNRRDTAHNYIRPKKIPFF